MGGREVTIPTTIKTVLSRSPIGTLIMYSLNPAKITGQNWTPTVNERQYLNSDFLKLPVLSGWYADGKAGNIEEIIKAAPDIIISTFFTKASKASIDQADRIQEQLDIPVLLINGDLESLEKTYNFIGGIINETARSHTLGKYTAEILTDVVTKASMVSEDMKVSVYYAEGSTGLQTDPAGSWHTRVIDLVNAINVGQVEMKSVMGRATVSPEQLITWEPDVIITCHDQGFAKNSSTYTAVLHDPRLSSLRAIADKKVYEVPFKPFNFIDRPPSINRLIGLKWLGHLLYPKIFNYDIRKETKEFYLTFYKIELSEEQLDAIFENAENSEV